MTLNMGRLTWSQVFPKLNKSHSLSLSSQGKELCLPPSHCICWICCSLSHTVGLELNEVFQTWSNAEYKSISSRNVFPNTAQDALAAFATRARCGLMLLPAASQHPQLCGKGLFLSQVCAVAFLFVKFHKILVGLILQVPLVGSLALRGTKCSPQFGVIYRTDESASLWLLIMMSNRMWPMTDPSVILNVTYLKAEYEPLTIIFWAWTCNQHLHA